MTLYLLDENHNPVLCADASYWVAVCIPHLRVALDDLVIVGEKIQVSTVFLGSDYSAGGKTPILFETMVFGGLLDQYQMRTHTWDLALSAHHEVVYMVRMMEEGLRKYRTEGC